MKIIKIIAVLTCIISNLCSQSNSITLKPNGAECNSISTIIVDLSDCTIDGELLASLHNVSPGINIQGSNIIGITNGIGSIMIQIDPGVIDSFDIHFELTLISASNSCSTQVGDILIASNVAAYCCQSKVDEPLSSSTRYGYRVDCDSNKGIVGAKWSNENGTQSGSAYLYTWNGSGWNSDFFLASDGEEFDQFGSDLAVHGNRILIGAQGDDNVYVTAGAVYEYYYNGNSWVESKILSPDPGYLDIYGSAVDMDGQDLAVVGAYGDDPILPGNSIPTSNLGAIYVLQWSGSSLTQTKIIASDGLVNSRYGNSVGISGNRVITGSYYDNDNGTRSGSAYIYEYNGASWVETKLIASDGAPNDWYGYSVAISGDRAVVGSPRDDDNGASSGSLYIYDWNGASWVESKLHSSDNTFNDNLGISVDIENDRILAGAYYDNSQRGATYIFDFYNSSWHETKIVASDAQTNYSFGTDVSLHDSLSIAGALGNTAAYFNVSSLKHNDADLDGFGDSSVLRNDCFFGNTSSLNNLDCDDANSTVYPFAPELCDGLDNDCNGFIDEIFSCLCPNGSQQNTFLGQSTFWNDTSNWSLGVIPTECDEVIIPSGLTVNIQSGNNGICYTIDVQNGAELCVPLTSILEVVAPNN